jgi:ribosome-associated protein
MRRLSQRLMSASKTPGKANQKKTESTGRTPRRKSPIEAARLCARIADQKKAANILLLKVKEIFSIADYFVICTCESRPQAKAIASEIEARLKKDGFSHIGTEGREDASWVLLDYGTVVVHIFLPETREYYQIEMLWGDAPEVSWKRSRKT